MSRGNILWEMAQNVAKALTSTEVWPLFEIEGKGHALGLSVMTAPESILTAVTNGFITAFAPGAIVINLNAAGATSTYVVFNAGSAAAPSWTPLIS